MRYVSRHIAPVISKAAKGFPAIILTGPRRAGKTMLLRKIFPRASFTLLEDPDVVARLRADPQGFLDGLRLPAILDEVQNVPELFAYVRARIDATPRRTGQYIFTGSQEAPLMQGVTESMAGRAAILHLYPLSTIETSRVDLLHGGFPEALARPRNASLWFSSYVQTYLERDVRAVTNVRDLATFRRFMALLATRHGQVLNRSEFTGPLGVSIPTINQWLGVLETTQQLILVPPFYESLGKRLIKSPKVYFTDSGLACHLLGITTKAELERSPFLGALFEGFVAAEIVKRQVNAGQRRELYHFRDQQGLEVDFLVPGRNGALTLIECKATRSPFPAMASSLLKLKDDLIAKRPPRTKIEAVLLHRRSTRSTTRALLPGTQAMDIEHWLKTWK